LKVDFVYEDEIPKDSLSKVSLKVLDETFKIKLIKACTKLRVTEISALIAEVEGDFELESKYMKKLADKFDYENLIELLNK